MRAGFNLEANQLLVMINNDAVYNGIHALSRQMQFQYSDQVEFLKLVEQYRHEVANGNAGAAATKKQEIIAFLANGDTDLLFNTDIRQIADNNVDNANADTANQNVDLFDPIERAVAGDWAVVDGVVSKIQRIIEAFWQMDRYPSIYSEILDARNALIAHREDIFDDNNVPAPNNYDSPPNSIINDQRPPDQVGQEQSQHPAEGIDSDPHLGEGSGGRER